MKYHINRNKVKKISMKFHNILVVIFFSFSHLVHFLQPFFMTAKKMGIKCKLRIRRLPATFVIIYFLFQLTFLYFIFLYWLILPRMRKIQFSNWIAKKFVSFLTVFFFFIFPIHLSKQENKAWIKYIYTNNMRLLLTCWRDSVAIIFSSKLFLVICCCYSKWWRL